MEEGGTARFRCVGTGIPEPIVKWYNEFGELLTEGTDLVMEDVQVTTRNPTFICVVASDSGTVQDTASLTVYSKYRVCQFRLHA